MRHFLPTALAALVAACATTPTGTSSAQQLLNTTAIGCTQIDAAIVGANQAVLSGLLKGKDKDNAIKGLTAAQQGCVVSLAAFQSAASGAAK